jgi:hypothetical protein
MSGSLSQTVLLASILLAACTAPNPLFTDRGEPDAAAGLVPDARPRAADSPPAPDVEPPAPDVVLAPDVAQPAPGPGASGAACTGPGGCLSGFCVDGVCCESACRERCRSCALAGSLGSCALIPAGADPRQECPAQDPATCGRAGGCDGQGDCLPHPPGTECRARSCSTGIEVAAALCDGKGTCTPGASTACALAACTGDRCSVGCTPTCPSGFQCQAGTCLGSPPALHWRFDEPSGTAAVDSSPNGLTGTYQGNGAMPTPSTSVPQTTFADPRSRDFGATGSPGVQLVPVPALLRPSTTVTVRG